MTTELAATELDVVEVETAAAPATLESDCSVAIEEPADSLVVEGAAAETEIDEVEVEKSRWQNGLDWPVVIWIAAVHLGLLAAPFFFTWKAVALMAFLHWLTGGIGVCLGYHRQLTHGSFSTYRPVRYLLALLGGLSGEGSALTW
ncbi:MAG TPA: acyl-CoA desaturase, partial [Pirellulales bacterium]|nr:acyl-CoA desaturase [Pirellulales bacterium]